MNIKDRMKEIDMICEEEHIRIYKEHGCEQQCDCIFSKEDIERLVALCDEEGYIVPRGLTREERRKYVKEVGRLKYLLTKEQVRKIGEHSLRKYAETSPSNFKAEGFIDLTNESDKGDIVNKL